MVDLGAIELTGCELFRLQGVSKSEEQCMFDSLFQPMHLLVLLIIAMFVFGPKRLPELGKAMGDGIRSFRNGMKDTISGRDESQL